MLFKEITPSNEHLCNCNNYLSQISSWEDVLKRHLEQHNFTTSLTCISDTKEDWIVDIFQCTDCGKYWAREDVGSPFLTKSLSFFYYIDTNPLRLYIDYKKLLVLYKLESDSFFKENILPRIQIK